MVYGLLVTIPAHSAPPEQPSWVGESKQSELHAIMASLRKTGEKSITKPTHPKTLPPLVRAAARVWIPAYTSSLVQVLGPFDLKGEWIVECLLVTTLDASALCAPSTFIKADGNGMAQIPVANFSPHPCIIQLGEVLGVARNPQSWLDEPSARAKAEAEKMAAFIDKLSQDWGKMKPSLNREEEEELIGPKMAEVPESETLPSSNLATILDISPEAPPELQHRVKDRTRKHQGAFSFDDRLGNPTGEVKIDTVPGAHPISLPMYRASSQKREVIDAQIDKWLEQIGRASCR